MNDISKTPADYLRDILREIDDIAAFTISNPNSPSPPAWI